MSKLPDGWTLYESGRGDIRSASHATPRVDVDQVLGGRALIQVYGSPFYADELADLIPVLAKAADIARQWDEERGAK